MVPRTLRTPWARRVCALSLGFVQFVCVSANRPVAAAADVPQDVEAQTREFAVSVDGRPRGSVVMQIRRRNDGTDLMHVEATIRILNLIVYKYTYSSSGTEIWKNGRLMEMDGVADYNGSRYVVKAAANSGGLQVNADGATSQLPGEAWVSSYWQIPERIAAEAPLAGEGASRGAGRPVTILDSDKGRALHGKLKRVGEETLPVNGQPTSCTHYRIGGDVQVNLWYDTGRRLVRQESVESGHKIRLELARIAAE